MRQTIRLLLLILLTSCSSSNDKIQVTPIPQKKSNTNLLHLQKISHQSAKNAVVLLVPMSGSNSSIGEGVVHAGLLACKNSGTEFYVVDTVEQNDSFKLHEQFKNKNLKAIIGPVFYHEAQKYGALFPTVPVLSLSNNLKINNGHVVACGVSPQNEIHKLVHFAKSKHMRGILAILPKTEYGELILSSLRNEADKFDEELEVVRYSEISREDATKYARVSGKQMVFVIEPILIASKLKRARVFTLSSLVLNNIDAWNGAIFAFSDNQRQDAFAEEYKMYFGKTPNIIDVVAYDLIQAVTEAASTNTSLFDTDFEGCLGRFSINKKDGLRRDFKVLTVMNSDITEYPSEIEKE